MCLFIFDAAGVVGKVRAAVISASSSSASRIHTNNTNLNHGQQQRLQSSSRDLSASSLIPPDTPHHLLAVIPLLTIFDFLLDLSTVPVQPLIRTDRLCAFPNRLFLSSLSSSSLSSHHSSVTPSRYPHEPSRAFCNLFSESNTTMNASA